MSAGLLKGAIADATKRAKRLLRLEKQNKTYTDKPVVRRATVTYPDGQDWLLQGDTILLRTQCGWVEIPLRMHRQH